MRRIWHALFGPVSAKAQPRARKPERERMPRMPEDIMEEELASMDMHYGDEPLYYSDPPQWPATAWTP